MKKLIASIIALIVVTVVIFSAQTVAYFTDDDINSVISLEGLHLSGEIIETTASVGGGEPVQGPTEMRIIPGAKVGKTVSVKNTGDIDMYLRIKVDKEFTLSPENEGKPTDGTLISFEINGNFWEERDGFYYYKTKVGCGETTEPLFTEIEFSSKMNNVYTNSTVSFRVKAYATQATGNGTSVFDAQGWPDAS